MPSRCSNLWQAFTSTVARQPNSPALVFSGKTVSFESLAERAERCAAYFYCQKLKPKSVVALQLPKWPGTYAIWLACLRQGLIYVFVDPKNPPNRTQSILDRVKPAVFISSETRPNPYGTSIRIESQAACEAWIDGLPNISLPEPAAVRTLDPAYIMFTSGSTGEPKGAVIPHQGVLSLMRWAQSFISDASNERFANINPLHFDNAVFDLYCGLVAGGALVPIETGNLPNPAQWVRELRISAATVLFAVPTLFQTLDRLKLLRPDALSSLRIFIFGGEGYPVEALKPFYERFQGRARLINVYGPTETSCICSSLEITDAALDSVSESYPSLGRMHPDFDFCVLTENGDTVVPGETGELWIGGPNVGLGYYGNPEETQRRFRQDPNQDNYRAIWYRSGDLVRVDEAGLLWFEGRIDNQVKIRGHRIELEEIDLMVGAIAGITRAVAVSITGPDGPELRVAFVAERVIPTDEIYEYCAARLPSYMRPTTVRQVQLLPQNANGKIDRKAVQAVLRDIV